MLRSSWRRDTRVGGGWVCCWIHYIITTLVWPWDIVLLSGLGTNSSKSSESWTSLFIMVVMLLMGMQVVVVALHHWVSVLCILLRMTVVVLVSLVELIQIRSGPFSINCRYLSHYLAIGISFRCLLRPTSCGLVWTDFGRTLSSWVLVVLVLACSVWRCPWIVKSNVVHILIIINPRLFKVFVKELEPFSVALVKSIPSKLSEFSVCDLFGFLHLCRV